MIIVNIDQAKTHFSKYITKVEHGENVVVCKRNIPIAEIRPILHRPTNPRPTGLAKGIFEIPANFFDPLPEDILTIW